jgi:hypothetical protein
VSSTHRPVCVSPPQDPALSSLPLAPCWHQIGLIGNKTRYSYFIQNLKYIQFIKISLLPFKKKGLVSTPNQN